MSIITTPIRHPLPHIHVPHAIAICSINVCEFVCFQVRLFSTSAVKNKLAAVSWNLFKIRRYIQGSKKIEMMVKKRTGPDFVNHFFMQVMIAFCQYYAVWANTLLKVSIAASMLVCPSYTYHKYCDWASKYIVCLLVYLAQP